MADLATILNPLTAIAASGAARTIAAGNAIDPIYDVTLSADCVFTLSASNTGRRQVVELWLHQDASGNRVATFPGVGWANGAVPVSSSTSSSYDILQFASLDGVKWLGSVIALGVVTPAKPSAPTLSIVAGNASNTITFLDGAANGSPITSRKLYRSTTAGFTPSAANLIGPITLTAGAYTDTGLTNGTTYYYRATTVNAVGESDASTEKSGLPTTVHYLNGGRATTTKVLPAGFVDIITIAQFNAMPTADTAIMSGTNNTGGAYVYISSSAKLAAVIFNGTSASFAGGGTALPASLVGQKVWLRAIINGSSAAVTYGGNSWNTQTASFFYSIDGTNYTGLGFQACGLLTAATVGLQAGGLDRTYGMVIKSSDSVTVANPDFSAQTTGTTSFNDAAGNPWTVPSGASIA